MKKAKEMKKIGIWLIVGLCFSLNTQVKATVGIEGPVQKASAPDLVIDFYKDGQAVYKKRTFGKGNPVCKEIKVQGTVVDDGISVHMDATHLRGGHGVLLNWDLSGKSSDWTPYSELVMWFKAPAGSALDYVDEIGVLGYRFLFSVKDSSGKVGNTAVYIKPETLGQWQCLVIPLNDRWSRELDKETIKNLTISLPALKDVAVDYELAGLGLQKQLNYNGPKLAIDVRPMHLMITPEESFCFTGLVKGIPEGEAYELHFAGIDVYGNKTCNTYNLVSKSKDLNYGSFNLPNNGQGHLTITGTLSQNGKDLYSVEWMMGSLPPVTDEMQNAANNQPWGFWPGAGPDAVMAGAKWTRLRIHPEWFTDQKIYDQDASPVDNGEWRLVQKVPFGMKGICCWFSNVPKECGRNGKHWWEGNIDWDDYEKVVEKMAAHCKEMGIRHYEACNEPNTWPRPSFEQLVQLHMTVYQGVKKVDPEAIIMGPSPYCLDSNFVDKFLEAGGKKFVDAISMHAYGKEGDLAKDIGDLRKVMAKHGLAGKDIYITEVGCNVPPHSLAQQARTAVRFNVSLFALGVKAVTWHGLSQWGYEPNNASKERNLGFTIMEFDGEPAPAFVAYGVMTRTLGDAKYAGPVPDLPENCRGESFIAGNREVKVLWNLRSKAQQATVKVNQNPRLINMMGKEIDLKVNNGNALLELTENPVYLVSNLRGKK